MNLTYIPFFFFTFLLFFCTLCPLVFLFQSDNLLSYLTVEETLTYIAQLALRKHSVEAIKKKVTPEILLCSVHLA